MFLCNLNPNKRPKFAKLVILHFGGVQKEKLSKGNAPLSYQNVIPYYDHFLGKDMLGESFGIYQICLSEDCIMLYQSYRNWSSADSQDRQIE